MPWRQSQYLFCLLLYSQQLAWEVNNKYLWWEGHCWQFLFFSLFICFFHSLSKSFETFPTVFKPSSHSHHLHDLLSTHLRTRGFHRHPSSVPHPFIHSPLIYGTVSSISPKWGALLSVHKQLHFQVLQPTSFLPFPGQPSFFYIYP